MTITMDTNEIVEACREWCARRGLKVQDAVGKAYYVDRWVNVSSVEFSFKGAEAVKSPYREPG